MPQGTSWTRAKSQGKTSDKLFSCCGFSHKFGQCPAKEAKCKIFKRLVTMQKFAEVNTEKQNQMMIDQVTSLLGLQEIRRKTLIFSWWQMENEILESTPRGNFPWIDSIHVQSEKNTTYSAQGCPKVHKAHKTRSQQALTRVLMFATNRMGKVTGNKPKGMKCKLDTGAGVKIMLLSMYKYINPSEFDEQGKSIHGHGQYRSILKDYSGNPIQQYGIWVILGKWNNKYWRFVFHVVEAEVSILSGLKTMWKMGLFTMHLRVSTGTTDIYQEQQNQARCDWLEVESIIRQGAAGQAAEAQCSRSANYTQTPTGQGYVNPKHSNNKVSVSFLEGLRSALSLQNRQLRRTFPATKLQANREAVKASPQTRQVHSRHWCSSQGVPTVPSQPGL